MNDTSHATTYELASMGNRLVAFIIDYLIMSAISFIIFMFVGSFVTTLFQLLILDIAITAGYHWYYWTRRDGQTPGKRIMNIRVIKTDGSALSDSDALLRIFGYYVGRMTLGLGYLWAVFDENNQGWQDKMANTYVIATEASTRKTINL